MGSKDITVLIVEDDINIREALRVAFKPLFSKIYTASDGDIALSIYKNNQIDVVITDMNMPNLDGASLIETIRNTNTHIPVFITTGYSTFEYTYDDMFNIFVYTKPVNVTEIYDVILSIEDDIIKMRKSRESYNKLKEVSDRAKEILRVLQEDRGH